MGDPYEVMREAYYREWKAFVEKGYCNDKIIRPQTLDSWTRCRDYGLNPLIRNPNAVIEDDKKLEEVLSSNKFLIDLAKPYMEILAQVVDETGFIGFLASKEGYILHIVGDPVLIKSAENGFVRIGEIRTEKLAGTTAVALCLTTRQPVQIFSAEHYHCFYHDWTCSAAPICDEYGDLIGVLNLSGNYRLIHKHTLGIVISLAKAIEHAIRLKLTNTYLHNCINSSEYGMIILDNKNNIKYMNKHLLPYRMITADELEKPIGEVLVSEPPLGNLLESDNTFFEKSIVIKNSAPKRVTLLVNTKSVIDNENQVIGKLIVTQEKKDVHRLVNRMVGAYASFTFDNILGSHEKLLQVIELARSAAETNARVLIQGESGTGKELFAQAIHNASKRRNGPFIGINCSAIPSELMESEIFGYNEGAFSGAKKGGMPGKFELAEGGTIFLDEIDSMPQAMQIKLLRVLEENKITRIGGNVVMPTNVRIIAASGKNLEELVRQGHIRLDFYYRINTIILDIPPLRNRKADIPLLADYLANMLGSRLGLRKKLLSEEFVTCLMRYDWPGNVRELSNVIERALIVSGEADTLTTNHLRLGPPPSPKVVMPGTEQNEIKTLKEVEREAIINALKHTNNNYVAAAQLLGIHRNTLYNKFKENEFKLSN
ncbi:MAG TPA: sigma 54-interacting transcriptional regulator [Selenomonadales bacterium]|nr:sigma 54-interacting transcriptional regulator [Selenomonadales bacterium]